MVEKSMEYLHLEHDGKLLLVDDAGQGPLIPVPGRENCERVLLRLPTVIEAESMGLEWTEKRRNTIRWEDVQHCVIVAHPHIDWPLDWAWKDDVIADSAAHPVARESVYRTMHRLVSKVIILDQKKRVLMGRVERGHFVGSWTLPGGYLDYSEHPERGAVRETLEEMGLDIELTSEAPVISQNIFSDEGINFVSFTYRAEVDSDRVKLKPKQGEIAEAGWFSIDEAIARSVSWFDRRALSEVNSEQC